MGWLRPDPELRDGDAPLLEARGVGLAYDLRLARSNKKLGRRLGVIAWGGDRQHRQHWALRGIDLVLRPGERLGVIGGNGAGKTSLLSVLTGILDPSEGELTQWGEVEAMIGLSTGLENELTGRENAALGAELAGLRGAAATAYAEEALAFAELGEMADAPVNTYSSGMKARLGFALATGRSPDLLLIDEVLSTGDAAFRARAEARIAELFSRTGAVVLVSHKLDEIERHCTRAIVLAAGRIVFDGDPAAAVAHYHATRAA